MFDATLVMKRDTLQEIVLSGKGDTMLMLPKIMNHKKKFRWEKDDSDEEYVLTATLTGALSHEE